MTTIPSPSRKSFRLHSILYALLFLTGIFLELSLSGGVLWGEVEARINISQAANFGLDVKCPLVLSPAESGTILAEVTNTTDRETRPVVTAMVSYGNGIQEASQTLDLAPDETQTLRWTVDQSNIVFGRLILVTVVQSRYSILEPRQGTCGIFILRERFLSQFVANFNIRRMLAI